MTTIDAYTTPLPCSLPSVPLKASYPSNNEYMRVEISIGTLLKYDRPLKKLARVRVDPLELRTVESPAVASEPLEYPVQGSSGSSEVSSGPRTSNRAPVGVCSAGIENPSKVYPVTRGKNRENPRQKHEGRVKCERQRWINLKGR
jgi:hypothetical protein